MRHPMHLHRGYHCVFALAVICLLAGSLPAAAGRAYGDNSSHTYVAGRLGAHSSQGQAGGSAYSEYMIGVYLLESGAVLRAVNHLEEAWRLSAHDPTVGLRLAEACFVLKNFSRCEMVVDNILLQEADGYEALMLKAKVRYVRRDRTGAIEYLERIREVHGMRFEIERLMGNIAYETGDLEKALEAYQNCIDIDDSHPYIHYRYGVLLSQAYRFTEAEAVFQRAIELDPGFVEPALDLAEIYLNTGRPNDAIPVLEDVVDADLSNTEALIALIQVYLETGHLDQGVIRLEERAQKGALPRELEILRGRLYYEARDYGEAFTVFSGLLESGGDNPELARILGEISLRMGEPDRALHYFDMAIEMDPNDYRSYIGKFFAGSPNFNDGEAMISLSAEEHVALLVKSEPLVKGFDFEGNYLLGISWLSVDSLDAARRFLLRANEIKADDRGTLLNLASVYEKTGELGEAETYLKQLYTLNPEDGSVCNFYGYLLAEMKKDLDLAEDLILKALETDPENGYYLDSLGWVYYQMGNYSKAVAELEKASLRVTDDPVILEHLGDAYRALRRFEEARTAYEKSNRLQDGNADILEKIQSTTSGNE